jgi:hypothetical protein
VLLLLQALFWLIAGISALPFALGGEVFMAALGVVTMLLALATVMLAIGVLWRRRRARGLVIALEVMCLFGTAVLLLLPVGFNSGVVSLMVNIGLPVAVIVLLRKEPGEAFT